MEGQKLLFSLQFYFLRWLSGPFTFSNSRNETWVSLKTFLAESKWTHIFQTMYKGVLKDDERRREKMRQREEDLVTSQRKREIYERVQTVEKSPNPWRSCISSNVSFGSFFSMKINKYLPSLQTDCFSWLCRCLTLYSTLSKSMLLSRCREATCSIRPLLVLIYFLVAFKYHG